MPTLRDTKVNKWHVEETNGLIQPNLIIPPLKKSTDAITDVLVQKNSILSDWPQQTR